MEKLVLHEPHSNNKEIKKEKPSFLSGGAMGRGLMKIGMINMEEDDVSEWTTNREIINVSFDKVSDSFEWKDLFPEWIDEEEEIDGPSCPEIPMPDFNQYGHVDMVVAKLPCRLPEEGLQRDVFRLQVHLVAANLAVRRGKWDRDGKMTVVFLSKCSPMVELFRCNELVTREGEWWLYRPELVKLQQKVNLPVGSCDLAMPLWAKGIIVLPLSLLLFIKRPPHLKTQVVVSSDVYHLVLTRIWSNRRNERSIRCFEYPRS